MNDRVSRYWQVFKLRHRVLTAAALHLLGTNTRGRKKKKKGKYARSLQKLLPPSSLFSHPTITGDSARREGRVAGELIRVGCQAPSGPVG